MFFGINPQQSEPPIFFSSQEDSGALEKVSSELTNITVGVISAVRGFGIAVSSDSRAMNNLGPGLGIAGFGLGIREAWEGTTHYKRAQKIADKEGKERAKARLFSGSVMSIASSFYLASQVVHGVAAGVIGAVSSAFFGIGSLFTLGLSALGIRRCHRFLSRLDEKWGQSGVGEVERCRNTLTFLFKMVVLSPEEEAAARAENFEPNLKRKAREQYFRRRVSTKGLKLLKKAEPLLKQLECEKTRAEAIEKTASLIALIKKETAKKIALFAVAWLAAAITLIGIALGIFPGGKTASFALFGVASILYFGQKLYSFLPPICG